MLGVGGWLFGLVVAFGLAEEAGVDRGLVFGIHARGGCGARELRPESPAPIDDSRHVERICIVDSERND